MEFIEWALQVAQAHPQLQDALITTNEKQLSILMKDGHAFTLRLEAILDKNDTQAHRTEMLNHLISAAIKYTQKNSSTAPIEKACIIDPLENIRILPVVQDAGYFLNSYCNSGEDCMIHMPLTDFIGMGLVYDSPNHVKPIYYSTIEENETEIGDFFSIAIGDLRRLSNVQILNADSDTTLDRIKLGKPFKLKNPNNRKLLQNISMQFLTIAGAHVLSIACPSNYELSWLCDLDMMHRLAKKLSAHQTYNIPLFIPVTSSELLIVFSESPCLADLFTELAAREEYTNLLYPLPHTIAADGWREWIPLPGSRLSKILSELRYYYRSRNYREQLNYMERWSSENSLKSYDLYTTAAGEKVTAAQWNATDETGSVPDTEYLIFHRDPSPHPWDTEEPVHIALQSHIARELWPAGFQKDENAWPPRWEIKGFPDSATLAKFREAVDRII
ncbi:hypothetical protein [uncultured Arcanobacterium sp.]|uniref:hypothetical protein n=1 Tax=uncultured Arcanobacterium sp. TaxID=487520 RepID=UPI002637B548|nr:hypothetical protein [uncultured Arcanobacterium sp.]